MTTEVKNETQSEDIGRVTAWRQHHRLILMILGAVSISLALVAISMSLYNSSGAAQLDLSRPGYSSVREQAQPDKGFTTFPSTGSISAQTLDDFRAIYEKKATEATTVDAFAGDVLSDIQLGIDSPDEPSI